MGNHKNRRAQTPKPVRSRSRETMEFQLQHRGSSIPSGKAYKREKAGARRRYED